ncbi:MAG: YitT family protein [Marinifilaceae bacterium]
MNLKTMTIGKQKIAEASLFKTYGLLTLGSLVLAIGYTFFMTPYKIIPGGIYGIATILYYKLNIPIGVAALCFNIPLCLWGFKTLGSRFGVKTVICFLLIALFADGLPMLFGSDPFNLQDEMLLASIFGGVVMGVGVGLIFKTRSSSGGTDVFSSILTKLTGRSIGFYQILIDSVIVMCGLLVFQDWKVPFYSWITIFIMGKVIDVVLQGISNDKTFFIVSNRQEEIRNFILFDLNRGGSIVPVNGMYNRTEKEMIMTVVSLKEVTALRNAIYSIDPNAFTMIMDAKEILGQGFKKIEKS